TGGAGFIGSNFVLAQRAEKKARIINLDKLTYAGNPANLESLKHDPDYIFTRGDVADQPLVRRIFKEYRPDAVVHFAAESHVDRSIVGPDEFVQTNIVGTFRLHEEASAYWAGLSPQGRESFRFLHISTDEVYGSLGPDDPPFTESHVYAPNSPYSASKAASDHLVRSYHKTYGLPVLIINCSNNYGPFQFPEKLIPLMIINALKGKPLPIYGDGKNVRDWVFVEDHARGIDAVLEKGRVGETYNIGGRSEKTNLEVVQNICGLLDRLCPGSSYVPHADLITFVKDRPGHDRRYAIDISKINRELGWEPRESFESGLAKTIDWYLNNEAWTASVTSGQYRTWIKQQYGMD
ncbi:MAG TPA: dTDP-glucose 4,6-dehydratase, partial [Desulfobacteraceae bacterium]|nr:dTDP-glucose 4,6-dehydratase [Desulfobacteraceae bacterium]